MEQGRHPTARRSPPIHYRREESSARIPNGPIGNRTALARWLMHELEMHTAAGQALDFTVKCDMYPEGTRLAAYRR
jgi:hypothetical protein